MAEASPLSLINLLRNSAHQRLIIFPDGHKAMLGVA